LAQPDVKIELFGQAGEMRARSLLHLFDADSVARNNANYAAPFRRRTPAKGLSRTNARILSKRAVVCWQTPKRSRSASTMQSRHRLSSEFDDGAHKGLFGGRRDAHFSMTFRRSRGEDFSTRGREGVIKSFRSLLLELSRNNCVSTT